jgi:general secretion pathway protein G
MKKSGFTLIEISVVTIILGLLATLGTLALMKSVQNARTKSAESELEILSAAVLQLAWDTGKWPNGQLRNNGGSIEKWDISPDSCGLMGTDGNFNQWKGPYYEGVIEDPWGNRYFFDPDYLIDGKNHIVIGSFGPNGVGPNLYDSDDIYVLLDD